MGFQLKRGFPRRPIQLAAIGCAILGLAVAAVWTLRIGIADIYFRRHSPADTAKAIRWTPGRADYQDRLAEYLSSTDRRRANEALLRAATLNPYDSPAWIRLGLTDEEEGRLPEASRRLHQAARVDRTFVPAWTLANFYYRRDDPGQFWYWIRQSVRFVPQNASPLFRLCWHFTNDGNFIASQLGLNRPDLASQYLSFLMSTGRQQEVEPIALRLAANDRAEDTVLLLRTTNWLITQHRAAGALDLWNRLANQHRISFKAIDATSQPIIINPNFLRSPTSMGFDWHLMATNGVTASQEDRNGGLRLEFSGSQPESAVLMTQVLAVHPDTGYQLLFNYTTTGIGPGTGLVWKVADYGTGTVLASSSSLSSPNGSAGQLDFTAPASSRFVTVSLIYQRALGTTRIEGSLVVHKVGLKKSSPQPTS